MQIAIHAAADMPNVPLVNAAEAMKADPTSEFYANIKSGENLENASKISFKGALKQSSERREYLRKSQVYEECNRQMERGQHLLPACRNATVAANRLNEATFSLTFDKVSVYSIFKSIFVFLH